MRSTPTTAPSSDESRSTSPTSPADCSSGSPSMDAPRRATLSRQHAERGRRSRPADGVDHRSWMYSPSVMSTVSAGVRSGDSPRLRGPTLRSSAWPHSCAPRRHGIAPTHRAVVSPGTATWRVDAAAAPDVVVHRSVPEVASTRRQRTDARGGDGSNGRLTAAVRTDRRWQHSSKRRPRRRSLRRSTDRTSSSMTRPGRRRSPGTIDPRVLASAAQTPPHRPRRWLLAITPAVRCRLAGAAHAPRRRRRRKSRS